MIKTRLYARESVAFDEEITVRDSSGNPIDVTGWSFTLALARQAGATDFTLLDASAGSQGIEVLDGAAGILRMVIDQATLGGIGDTTGDFTLFGDLLGYKPNATAKFIADVRLNVTTAGVDFPGSTYAVVLESLGAALLVEMQAKVDDAKTEADRSTAAANRSEAGRDSAIAIGRLFQTVAEGEAASEVGEPFSVGVAAGSLAFYRRTAGGSEEISPPIILGSQTIQAPTGDPNTAVQATKALEIRNGAGPWDRNVVLRQTPGSLSNLDLHGGGTGAQIRFFDPFGEIEAVVGDGNQNYSLKFGGYWAYHYDDTGVPGEPGYNRICHPPCQVGHMESVHADLTLARVTRPGNVVDGQAHLYMDNQAYGTRLDMADGAVRWPRPDARPLVGDVRSATPMGAIDPQDFPLELAPFNAGGLYGMRVRSTDPGTIGNGWWFLEQNGGIAGASGSSLIQNEGSALLRIGNGATHNTTINAAGQTVFEIAGANVAYLTATGFHPLTDATKDLGTNGLRWANLYLANNPIVGSDKRLKTQIGDIPVEWLDAWAEVEPRRFKYKGAVKAKGASKARWHIGYIAQDILKAFQRHGLDASEIGIVCHEVWDDEFEDEVAEVKVEEVREIRTRVIAVHGLVGKDSRPLTRKEEYEHITPAHTVREATGRRIKVRAAGEQWAVRYEQCAVLDRALALRERAAAA